MSSSSTKQISRSSFLHSSYTYKNFKTSRNHQETLEQSSIRKLIPFNPVKHHNNRQGHTVYNRPLHSQQRHLTTKNSLIQNRTIANIRLAASSQKQHKSHKMSSQNPGRQSPEPKDQSGAQQNDATATGSTNQQDSSKKELEVSVITYH